MNAVTLQNSILRQARNSQLVSGQYRNDIGAYYYVDSVVCPAPTNGQTQCALTLSTEGRSPGQMSATVQVSPDDKSYVATVATTSVSLTDHLP